MEEVITDLHNVTSGRYVITTQHGTQHELDLDEGTVVRRGAPGREWNGENGHYDGVPFRFVSLNYVTVGSRIYMTDIRGNWRMTSEIVSIEKMPDGTQLLQELQSEDNS